MKITKELLNYLEVRNSTIELSILIYHIILCKKKSNRIQYLLNTIQVMNMIADIMTKGLRKATFEQLRGKLGAVEIK